MTNAIAVPQSQQHGSAELWQAALELRCDLVVELAAPAFTIRDLLRLEPGSVVATSFKQAASVPLIVNGLVVAWTEFEVAGQQLAVRLMELV